MKAATSTNRQFSTALFQLRSSARFQVFLSLLRCFCCALPLDLVQRRPRFAVVALAPSCFNNVFSWSFSVGVSRVQAVPRAPRPRSRGTKLEEVFPLSRRVALPSSPLGSVRFLILFQFQLLFVNRTARLCVSVRQLILDILDSNYIFVPFLLSSVCECVFSCVVKKFFLSERN